MYRKLVCCEGVWILENMEVTPPPKIQFFNISSSSIYSYTSEGVLCIDIAFPERNKATSCDLRKYFLKVYPELESLVCHNSSMWSGLKNHSFVLLPVEELYLNYFWKLRIKMSFWKLGYQPKFSRSNITLNTFKLHHQESRPELGFVTIDNWCGIDGPHL